ncbi:hypothetical protein [Roseateles asaccharophilus]|uniref:Outer membrane murein-binding lipoprotein Lpp n=1 Tax=Roseateles asaccharophilus TaxID=582607 RepID=A0ABU2A4V1_9BURK|nr:hypothetical protein [Roseateles asaccharophilus]MDR7332216.1 outer membrane murein-binding lipoprotein Lpp [Roseateles asaccharophilus]
MNKQLNPMTSLIALAAAGLIAGCASQSQSDNESANNAASGQSDVVSQTNPLDSQAPADTMPAAPANQYAEAPQPAPTEPLTQPMDQTQPAPIAAAEPSPPAPAMDTSSTMSNTNTAPAYTEEALPPRPDRN